MRPDRQLDLLVHWEPWRSRLRGNLGPALRRSGPRWAGECEFSPARTRAMSCSGMMHLGLAVALVFAVVSAPATQMVSVRPFDPAEYEIRYVNPSYLPQMEDASGAETGVQGRSGGREAFHPRQAIRIYRGPAEAEKVIEAPQLRLPMTSEAVANVLVVQRVLPTVPVASKHVAAAELNHLAPEVVPPTADAALRQRLGHRNLELAVSAVPPSPDASRLATRGLDIAVSAVPPPPDADSIAKTYDLTGPEVVPPTVEIAEFDLPARTVDAPRLSVGPPPAAPVELAARVDGDVVSSSGSPSGASSGTASGGMAAGGAENGTSPVGGFVLSPRPGGTVGKNASAGGALAMSPDGTGTTGLGGSGGGSGTGMGSGPGSGRAGTGPGSGATGTGRGNSADARGGLADGGGPGGTGNGNAPAALPGVTIRGGNVTLGSFSGVQPGGTGAVTDPRNRPPLTVVATARSGGALPMYGQFAGARVYTIYIDTKAGMAVLQYSELAQASREFDVDLTAPEPLHIPVPKAVRSRILVSCTLGENGRLRDLKILEGAGSKAAAPLAAALADWIFRPAMRGDTPIAVQAVLGFSVDTK